MLALFPYRAGLRPRMCSNTNGLRPWFWTCTLSVTFISLLGDFNLNSSKLSVFGDDGGTPGDIGAVPVPEPANMLLFGTGLLGLAGTCRKKLFKK